MEKNYARKILFGKIKNLKTVLKIHFLVLMRIPIRTGKNDPDLNPDPNPGHFFKIYWFFFLILVLFAYFFSLKLSEPFRNEDNFYNLSFFKSSDLGFRR